MINEQFCTDKPTQCSAFASRLRESLADNVILGFLSTELEDEHNAAIVWNKIGSHLNSSDLSMAREMQNWTELFALKCEDRDSFVAFYSTAKKLLHKLTVGKSIAVTDDIFLKAFITKVIEVPELQSESKKFLMDGSGTHAEILEKIYADYCVQETGEQMKDAYTKPDTCMRRAGTGAVGSSKQVQHEPTKAPALVRCSPKGLV